MWLALYHWGEEILRQRYIKIVESVIIRTFKFPYISYHIIGLFLEIKTVIREIIYLRSHAANGFRRSRTVQAVTATIVVGSEWHCIATVDWLSVHLSLGSDGEHKFLWAGVPSWGGDNSALTERPGAQRCITVHPGLRVIAISVGWPQNDGVPTVDDWISVAFKSENRKTSFS